jgi:quercetin dioxygenase-like cupin family protein
MAEGSEKRSVTIVPYLAPSRLQARGEMILLPANVPHALRADTRFKMLLTMIRS